MLLVFILFISDEAIYQVVREWGFLFYGEYNLRCNNKLETKKCSGLRIIDGPVLMHVRAQSCCVLGSVLMHVRAQSCCVLGSVRAVVFWV